MPLSTAFALDQPFRALLFDCDGTLVDTAQAHLAAYNTVLARGQATMPWEFYRTRLGIPARELLLEFSAQQGLTLEIDAAIAGHGAAYAAGFAAMREIPHVAAIARAWHGRAPMAVGSNGLRAHVEGSLRGAGLLALFDAVVGVDDVAEGKPAPDIYLEAARRLNVSPEDCIVFEDSAEGMEAARRAGMRAYDVNRIGFPESAR